jgi:hypothetical protein
LAADGLIGINSFVSSGVPTLKTVDTILEPRTPTYHLSTGKIAYISADGSLREMMLDNAADRVLLSPDKQQSFTQPAYDAEGKRLFIVVLKEGASVDTDIAMVDGTQLKPLVIHRSAQFEPYFHPPHTLYYSHVVCTIDLLYLSA